MNGNPALVRDFDHRSVAVLSEYRAAGLAIGNLGKALYESRLISNQTEWLELVRNLTASLVFTDSPEAHCCDAEMFAPSRLVIGGDRASCTYLCEHGRQWKCWWALNLTGMP